LSTADVLQIVPILLLTAVVSSVGLTVVVGRFARAMGAVDRPDGVRKLHSRIVPLWGGLGVYLAFAFAVVLAVNHLSDADGQLFRFAAGTLVAGAGVCLIGAVDDRWLLSSRTKLLLQGLAVLPLIAVGYRIEGVMAFGVDVPLGSAGMIVTLVWLVGCINAMNFLDGMDGLASMVGAIVALMTAVIAAMVGSLHATVVAVCLTGALIGFLLHNLPPARIFLGDCGSMLIGLVLGLCGIEAAMKTSTTLAIAVPVLIMSLPILDTTLAVVRRRLTGRRVDLADRQHIHHRLLDRGMSTAQALLVIGALCVATGAASVLATWLRSDTVAWIAAALLLAVPVRLGWFGHHEFLLLRRALARTFAVLARRVLGKVESTGQIEYEQIRGMGFSEAWDVMVRGLVSLQVDQVELDLWRSDESRRRHGWRRPGNRSQPRWQLAVLIRGADGRACRLSTSGGNQEALSQAEADRLGKSLRLFALHFAETAELIPGVVVSEEGDPAVDLADPATSRAA